MLLSHGITTSTPTALLSNLSTINVVVDDSGGLLVTTLLSVWIWKSHGVFVQSFLVILTFGVVHFDPGTCNRFSAQMFLYTISLLFIATGFLLPEAFT